MRYKEHCIIKNILDKTQNIINHKTLFMYYHKLLKFQNGIFTDHRERREVINISLLFTVVKWGYLNNKEKVL